MPSVALLRHFFFLRINDGHTSGCANFVAAGKANAISKAGKKAEGFRSKWILVDAGRIHPPLILPTEQPSSSDDWSHAELVDPHAKPVLKKMDADLRRGIW